MQSFVLDVDGLGRSCRTGFTGHREDVTSDGADKETETRMAEASAGCCSRRTVDELQAMQCTASIDLGRSHTQTYQHSQSSTKQIMAKFHYGDLVCIFSAQNLVADLVAHLVYNFFDHLYSP